jgi:uncharacterized protein with HEPN domain
LFMNDEVRKDFFDVLQAGEEIVAFTRDMDFRAYSESPVTQRAVERDFEIIGEALNRIKRIDETLLETISEHHRIIGFRNVLIHGYDMVDERIVWNAVESHLAALIRDVQKLLDT